MDRARVAGERERSSFLANNGEPKRLRDDQQHESIRPSELVLKTIP